MDADRCVVCGEIIPEGRMVCYKCERSVEQAYEICSDVNRVSCDKCPIAIKCKNGQIDSETIGEIFAGLQKNKELLKQRFVNWIKDRFLKKR